MYLAYVPEHEPGTSGRLSENGEWEMIENAEALNISHTPSVRNKFAYIFSVVTNSFIHYYSLIHQTQ